MASKQPIHTEPVWVPGSKFALAVNFAIEWHGNDFRKIRGEPYLGHLFGVASLVIEYGGTEDQAIASFLHDLLEDTEITYPTLQEVFGHKVADMVMGCTDATYAEKAAEKSVEDAARRRAMWIARKQDYLNNLTAKTIDNPSVLVALADKVNNGEKSARDLIDDPDLFDHFNVPKEIQKWWYTELVKAFNTGNKFTDHQKVLLKRFEAAVESMFPATTK